MGFGYESERLRLVPLDYERHFENCYRWINDPEVSEWLGSGDLPMSRLAEKDWFDSVKRGSDTQVFFAIELLEGEHIGNTNLFRIDYRNGTAHTGSMIGAKGYWGKGYGSEAARLRAHYAFHVLGLRMLYSSYLDGNVRSQRMQTAAGYVEWGRQPSVQWKRGQYRDHIHTCLSRERWLELRSR